MMYDYSIKAIRRRQLEDMLNAGEGYVPRRRSRRFTFAGTVLTLVTLAIAYTLIVGVYALVTYTPPATPPCPVTATGYDGFAILREDGVLVPAAATRNGPDLPGSRGRMPYEPVCFYRDGILSNRLN